MYLGVNLAGSVFVNTDPVNLEGAGILSCGGGDASTLLAQPDDPVYTLALAH